MAHGAGSWETVAHTLAARLMHQAGACGHRVLDMECPSCHDTQAYEVYLTKCRETGRTPAEVFIPEGPSISLSDLARQASEEAAQ